MRRVAPALLALLLVLSGCSFLGGPRSPSPTPTPSPAAEVPGVSDGRLENASALLAAHRTALVESGFETAFQVNATIERSGSLVDLIRRQQTVAEPELAEYQYRLTTRGGAGIRVDAWGNRSVEVLRAQTSGGTRYQVSEPAGAAELTGSEVLSTYLSASNFTVERVVDDGERTLVVLTARGTANPGAVAPENATDVRDYQARLVVDTRGRIHRLDVTADYTIDGQDASLSVGFRLVRTDSPSLSQPEWAREALRS